MSATRSDPRALVQDVPDFPKPGIVFKDITPVLADPEALDAAVTALADWARPMEIDVVYSDGTAGTRGYSIAGGGAYAAAKQTAGDPDSFGSGRIEGVIAPEASSNAKEGGALVPTLALGIPGSASMALRAWSAM